MEDAYKEVMAWIRGGDTSPNQEMEEKFLDIIVERVMIKMGLKHSPEEAERLAEASRRRERRSHKTVHPLSLKAMLEEVRKDDLQMSHPPSSEGALQCLDETPIETLPWEAHEVRTGSEGIDSVVVAKSLQWMASVHDLQLNGSQIQSILYNAYGIWLARKGERLLSEHPQVWQYGPVFPRAYKHLKKNVGTGEVEYEILKNDHPSEFVFITKCFQRFAWTNAAILASPHTAKGSPWKSVRDDNPDKLGVCIDDKLIGQWFLPRL